MIREHGSRTPVGLWTIHAVTVSGEAEGSADRPTVVLVHGLGMATRSLLPTAHRLADEFRVVIPELPGNGGSSRPAEVLDVPGLAEALIGWMDGFGLHTAVLVGHSLGSQVAVHAAGRHPSRVSALVLVSPSRDPLIGTPWKKAWRLLLDGPRESPGLLLVAAVDYLRAGPFRMWKTLKASLDTDPVRTLGRVRQPTLVVRGDRDPLVSPWWASTICRLVGDGRTVTVEDGPHGLPFSRPGDLARAIRPFLHEVTVDRLRHVGRGGPVGPGTRVVDPWSDGRVTDDGPRSPSR